MNYVPESAFVKRMFGEIAEKYNVTNNALSFGIHKIWKKKLIRLLTIVRDHYDNALDLCTGTADLVPLIKQISNKVTGADFTPEMLLIAKKDYGDIYGVDFQLADAMNLPYEDQTFDLVTVSFGVRNFENLEKGLSEIYRVLKPEGIVGILEFGQPKKLIWKTAFNVYSKFVIPAIGKFLTSHKEAYKYLPETSKLFPSGNVFCCKLEELGFKIELCKSLSGGIAYIYIAKKL